MLQLKRVKRSYNLTALLKDALYEQYMSDPLQKNDYNNNQRKRAKQESKARGLNR